MSQHGNRLCRRPASHRHKIQRVSSVQSSHLRCATLSTSPSPPGHESVSARAVPLTIQSLSPVPPLPLSRPRQTRPVCPRPLPPQTSHPLHPTSLFDVTFSSSTGRLVSAASSSSAPKLVCRASLRAERTPSFLAEDIARGRLCNRWSRKGGGAGRRTWFQPGQGEAKCCTDATWHCIVHDD